jgi:hypothetical protein
MVEGKREFPFQKLRFAKYLTINVMMYVEHPEVYKFMFAINNFTRSFILKNLITIQNGFVNEGLITYHFEENLLRHR